MKCFNLSKLETKLVDGHAKYFLDIGEVNPKIELNSLVGHIVKLTFKAEINCIHCQKKIKKTYAEGLCFPCTSKLAWADMCILKPELCHYQKGTCRDPAWGINNCFIPHIVYLANSSGIKVGITRHHQLYSRWIDQGAIMGLPIIKVKSRYQSGVFEKQIASLVKDKTDWRKMLSGLIEPVDLKAYRNDLFFKLGDTLDQIESELGADQIEILEQEQEYSITYPVLAYPEKIKSMSFDKVKTIEGELLGIKGQYMIFKDGVINIRSHTGYKVELDY